VVHVGEEGPKVRDCELQTPDATAVLLSLAGKATVLAEGLRQQAYELRLHADDCGTPALDQEAANLDDTASRLDGLSIDGLGVPSSPDQWQWAVKRMESWGLAPEAAERARTALASAHTRGEG
jgi:lauroyl/myristoyl acyltransferase